MRAFKAGWGGVVWKTLGEDPPVVNVNGPRYGALLTPDRRMLGFNNIELITDRSLEVNFKEITDTKKKYPKHAVIVSLMVMLGWVAWRRYTMEWLHKSIAAGLMMVMVVSIVVNWDKWLIR